MSSGTPPDALGPSPDVLVVGGGLAGSAAAICLARSGRQVLLVEREPEPRHKVCGEFLSAEALALLRLVGLDAGMLEKGLGAVPVRGVRLCGARQVTESPLPFAAMSLTRRCLDPALLSAAESAGAEVLRGVTVEALARDAGQNAGRDAGLWRARLSDGRDIAAPHVVLASGKHDLRGLPRPAGWQNDLVALKMYYRLQPAQAAALRHHVELLLYPGGYAGLQPVEGGANLCCLIRRERLTRLGGWEGLLREIEASCPHARERLLGAEALLPKPLAIASIPYGFVRRKPMGDGLWAVGDQAAVIPSFTGDGMSIALYTGVRAAESLLRGETAAIFQAGLHRDLRAQVTRATLISQALVHSPSRAVLLGAVRLWPALLRVAARLTRVPAQAMTDVHAGF